MATSTSPALRIAEANDIDPVADLISHAFDHLGVIHFLVPDQSRRRLVSRDWYRLYVEHAISGAGQVIVTEDGDAAAVWFDRTSEPSEPDGYDKRLAELAGEHLDNFRHLDQQMENHHPSDPHWYLLFLAVHPDRWSHGLGSALLQDTHARLDSDGIPAYLEATGEQNQRLYQRHGYTDMAPPTITVSAGISLYRMWRPPQNTR
ncbi:GNAT family N-acetyltransferase [Actinoplanes aureus]|uniref:GNAT family N-acetyltransferase n=1 Tax=Actinoplanes aureus TaxID=2792083 RepID=A0A931G2K6_9ACTN|nr:GNAT family N-acetyltransferase [Actinoplanes aureus]MBG0569173.1 GNAT family N-acetyltransferase [Actinoplanes aureus]